MLKIISWNLYYRDGALAQDIARLIDAHNPDLVLMQEATPAIDALPRMAGGRFYKQDWHGKSYGLAVWVADHELHVRPLGLPYSRLPGTFPRRAAQLIGVDGLTLANVHLSHGQMLNRRQLRTIATNVEGPTAIVGDYNAIGPIRLSGFRDVGPQGTTHHAQNMMPLRLDRCMARDLTCTHSQVLEAGPSDHAPILLELAHDIGRGRAQSREKGWKFLRGK